MFISGSSFIKWPKHLSTSTQGLSFIETLNLPIYLSTLTVLSNYAILDWLDLSVLKINLILYLLKVLLQDGTELLKFFLVQNRILRQLIFGVTVALFMKYSHKNHYLRVTPLQISYKKFVNLQDIQHNKTSNQWNHRYRNQC